MNAKSFLHEVKRGVAKKEVNRILDMEFYGLNGECLEIVNSELLEKAQIYGQGLCHAWTVALNDILTTLKLKVIKFEDDVIHSFACSDNEEIGIDANGVQEFNDIVDYWENLARINIGGDACLYVEDISKDDLLKIINEESDEEDVLKAKSEIVGWTSAWVKCFGSFCEDGIKQQITHIHHLPKEKIKEINKVLKKNKIAKFEKDELNQLRMLEHFGDLIKNADILNYGELVFVEPDLKFVFGDGRTAIKVQSEFIAEMEAEKKNYSVEEFTDILFGNFEHLKKQVPYYSLILNTNGTTVDYGLNMLLDRNFNPIAIQK